MSESISEASAKRSADGDHRVAAEPRTANASPSSVPTWAWPAGSPAAASAAASSSRAGLPQASSSPLAASGAAVGVEDRAAAQIGRHRLEPGDGDRGVGGARGAAWARVRHVGDNSERVPGASLVADRGRGSARSPALLLALNGYSGYSIVVGAVGAAAAVNLL